MKRDKESTRRVNQMLTPKMSMSLTLKKRGDSLLKNSKRDHKSKTPGISFSKEKFKNITKGTMEVSDDKEAAGIRFLK